jgi:hypothetical protein
MGHDASLGFVTLFFLRFISHVFELLGGVVSSLMAVLERQDDIISEGLARKNAPIRFEHPANSLYMEALLMGTPQHHVVTDVHI